MTIEDELKRYREWEANQPKGTIRPIDRLKAMSGVPEMADDDFKSELGVMLQASLESTLEQKLAEAIELSEAGGGIIAESMVDYWRHRIAEEEAENLQ